MIPKNKNTLSTVIHSRDQPVFVASDIEDGTAADLIRGSEIGPQLGKVSPLGHPRYGGPVRQRRRQNRDAVFRIRGSLSC